MEQENPTGGQSPDDNPTENQQHSVRREVLSWVWMLVIVVVIVVVLMTVILINARVPSGSMEPTVMTKDRLIGFRFSYWFRDAQRGDLVLFRYPVDEDEMFIKRVIGLAGETVDIRDGKIYIDGSDTPLDENYLAEAWTWNNDGLHYEVPEDCYFVLGDNRNHSADSRVWAEAAIEEGLAATPEEAEKYTYVTQKELQGKAIFTYYPHFGLLTDTADYQ